MKRIFLLLTISTLLLAQTPALLFQQALLKENGEGDLAAAVAIYEKIVADGSAERALRAQAQLHIGICWEKMGRQEARTAFQKVLTDFADQDEAVLLAKAKLAESLKEAAISESGSSAQFKRLRKVEDYQVVLSPDRKFIAFTEKGQIITRELATGAERAWTLLDAAKRVSSLTWRHDGRAFCIGNASGCWIVPLDKGAAVQIARLPDSKWDYDGAFSLNPDGSKAAYISEGKLLIKDLATGLIRAVPLAENVASFFWALDGSRIAFTTTTSGNYGCQNGPPNDNDILLYDLQSSDSRHLIDPRYDGNVGGWSSTGRWLQIESDETGDCDVWIESKDGERKNIAASPANERGCSWSPDDRYLAIDTDRNGAREIWCISNDGKQAFPLAADINMPIPVGWPDNNQFIYLTYGVSTDIYRVEIDNAGRPIPGSQKQALPFLSGKTSLPCWSSDAHTLFFTHKKGAESAASSLDLASGRIAEYIRGVDIKRPVIPSSDGKFLAYSCYKNKLWHLVLHAISTGQADTLLTMRAKIDLYDWSPDGRLIAFSSVVPGIPDAKHPRRGRYDIFITDVVKRTTTPLFETPGEGSYLAPRWSPDSKVIAYVYGKADDEMALHSIRYFGSTLPDDRDAENLTGEIKKISPYHDWSPTGEKIVFTVDQSPKLMILDLVTKGITEIDCGAGPVIEPAWSPNGKMIVYTVREAGWELWSAEHFLPAE